ncbi:winged helix-turn-helix transcriptional regulator [Dyella telluris]|uniref:Helix-turn-helix transcriptional regulator n=1 Tax=Dyella telluris TaxID=2763498 RepID=A0A7G8Q8T3_9GAMM|nr:helix-turn-helix domain-containing protein [Dyella telluris]QNK03191.1 helix-turn-helix transcriptional regulator [Dyella telluris]
MRHHSTQTMACPIARAVDQAGDAWSVLILRDAFYGLSRFDDFQASMGIAPNILSRRLALLVDTGMLERRRYSSRPPRHEYLLTERGRDFRPVLLAMMAWGNRHFSPDGHAVELIDRMTGHLVEPVMVDGRTGEPITRERHQMRAGPAADERMRSRIAFRNSRLAQPRPSLCDPHLPESPP